MLKWDNPSEFHTLFNLNEHSSVLCFVNKCVCGYCRPDQDLHYDLTPNHRALCEPWRGLHQTVGLLSCGTLRRASPKPEAVACDVEERVYNLQEFHIEFLVRLPGHHKNRVGAPLDITPSGSAMRQTSGKKIKNKEWDEGRIRWQREVNYQGK